VSGVETLIGKWKSCCANIGVWIMQVRSNFETTCTYFRLKALFCFQYSTEYGFGEGDHLYCLGANT
jgi:hypothetical protein